MTRTIRLPVRQIAMLSFLVALTAMLSGCNTMEGMGRDVQSGGRALERSAD